MVNTDSLWGLLESFSLGEGLWGTLYQYKNSSKTLGVFAHVLVRYSSKTVVINFSAPFERDQPAHQHCHFHSLATCPSNQGLVFLPWQLEISSLVGCRGSPVLSRRKRYTSVKIRTVFIRLPLLTTIVWLICHVEYAITLFGLLKDNCPVCYWLVGLL